jgi:hypothetical protein
MEPLIGITCWILSGVFTVITKVLAEDIRISADRVCGAIIRSAALRVARFDQDRLELEWVADLSERETVYEKYRHAVGCFLVAGRMRRAATTVRIAVEMRLAGMAVVPFNLKLSPKILVTTIFAGARSTTPLFRRATIYGVLIYFGLKLAISAHRLGRARFAAFANGLKLGGYKNWKYQARITGNNIDLDLSAIFHSCIVHPERRDMIRQRFVEWAERVSAEQRSE